MRRSPYRVSTPCLDAPARSPDIPATEFSDHESATWPEHARYFTDGALRLRYEAKYSGGHHAIEGGVGEGQCLGLPERQAHMNRFLGRAYSSRIEHAWIGIETRDQGSAHRQRGCENAIAASNIQHIKPLHTTEHIQQQLVLEPVGRSTKGACSPTRVGIGEWAAIWRSLD